jgi:hypothetical protein
MVVKEHNNEIEVSHYNTGDTNFSRNQGAGWVNGNSSISPNMPPSKKHPGDVGYSNTHKTKTWYSNQPKAVTRPGKSIERNMKDRALAPGYGSKNICNSDGQPKPYTHSNSQTNLEKPHHAGSGRKDSKVLVDVNASFNYGHSTANTTPNQGQNLGSKQSTNYIYENSNTMGSNRNYNYGMTKKLINYPKHITSKASGKPKKPESSKYIPTPAFSGISNNGTQNPRKTGQATRKPISAMVSESHHRAVCNIRENLTNANPCNPRQSTDWKARPLSEIPNSAELAQHSRQQPERLIKEFNGEPHSASKNQRNPKPPKEQSSEEKEDSCQ